MYPDNNQVILINKTFGCIRFVYNYFLNKCKNNKYYKITDICIELNKREKQLKRLQRKLAKQINHSKNYNRLKIHYLNTINN